MANHKSAVKRARANDRKRVRNRQYLSSVKTAVKRFKAAVTGLSPDETISHEDLFKAAQSLLMKAATKGILHRNNASRRIGRLADTWKRERENAKNAPASTATKKTAKSGGAKKTAKSAASKGKATTKKK